MKTPSPSISVRTHHLVTGSRGFTDAEEGPRQSTEIRRRILSLAAEGLSDLEELIHRLQAEARPGAAPSQRADIVRELYALEQEEAIEIRLPCGDEVLETVYRAIHALEGLCLERPGLWNVVAYEREWGQYGEYFDFLEPGSPNYSLKRFQRRLYMEHIQEFLDGRVRRGARVLDAGGGVGRFSEELAQRGYDIFLVDSSERALKCAMRHLEHIGWTSYHLLLADAAHLANIPDGFFQATFAIELVCYCTEPERAVGELVRVTAPGGLLFLSVEGRYGSMLADPKVQADHFETIMDKGTLLRRQDVFVRYFTDEEFRAALERHGLEVVRLEGTHYVPDGIFHRFVQEKGLESAEAEEALLAIEKRCSLDPVLKPLARAWLAVCVKR